MSENAAMQKICENCQAALDADAVFCNDCGLVQSETAGYDTKTCPRCGREMNQKNKFCPGCAYNFSSPPAGPTVKSSGDIQEADKNSDPLAVISTEPKDKVSALNKRYKDGYRVAAAIETFGGLLKVGGIFAGCAIGFFGFIMAGMSANAARGNMFSPTSGAEPFIVVLMIFGFIGGIVFAVGWALGVIVSAQGQLLKANLDCAVNSSPFLTDLSKAEIMSLPSN